MHKIYLSIISILCLSTNLLWAQVDTIADQKIQEVVVIAKLPSVQIQPDKTTFRLDASVTHNQGSLYDALCGLPGVIVNNDGTIILNGQPGVNVLMDGKSTYLSGQELVNLLKSTPATTAEKIDLITHPSARFDASGNSGIIDIHSRKIKLRGMNLSLNGNFTQGRYSTGYGSASLNYRREKFNVFTTYSYYQGQEFNELNIARAFIDPRTGEETGLNLNQNSYRHDLNKTHYYRIGLDYYITDRTTLGFTFNGNHHSKRRVGTMDSYFQTLKDQPDSTRYTWNDSQRKTMNLSAGVNFLHKFDSKGKVLDASFDYLRFKYNDDQFQHDLFQDGTSNRQKRDSLKGLMNGILNLYTGQVNLVLPHGDKWSLDAGAKTSFVHLDNSANYTDIWNGKFIHNASISNRFVYDENINAGYLQLKADFKPLHIEAGLRVENTRVTGKQSGNSVQRDSSFTQRYTNVFPTLLMLFSIRESSLSLFYGRRIVRPDYGDLNPFIYIFDNYTYEQGNTMLKPQLSDNLELAYIHKTLFKASFFFTHIHDVIVKSFSLMDDNRMLVSPANYSSAFSLGPRISTSNLPLASFWDINVNASAIYNHFQWLINGEEQISKRLAFVGGLNNQFTLGKGWSAELNVSYRSKMAAGQALMSPVWQMDAGVKKQILKGKGSIQLYARDIFNTYNRNMNVVTPDQKAYVKERESQSVIGISFSYRFNSGYNAKESRRKSSIDESKRINL
ncbi:outer membrane beta-barrel family protein [Parabacteroides bouchesdurhonensis]|uniref:outer membrane beta-barrel family protein n=1 Tax=Parabacteroides bouchesdurhonensis TaxID=1936995 RepID=UPI000C842D2B|nr:outer membrane beta-barrel family protein [Parabacteroides bouchesdurhonensis]